MTKYHTAVLLNESVEGLIQNPNGIYVDATFGGGGHSREILKHLKGGRLIAFDRDTDAAQNAIDDERFTLINQNFAHIKRFLRLENVKQIDGLLADYGVSSHQFDTAERGFSIRFDGPLDMRMNKEEELTAADVINNYDLETLTNILKTYGEVNSARKIAQAFVTARDRQKIETLEHLRNVIAPFIKGLEHKFLAKIFQALRIEVNGELDAIQQLLTQSAELIKPGGRLVVISYHSLEDRLVKNFIKRGSFDGIEQKDIYGRSEKPFKEINKKVIIPSPKEIAANKRARSAKLRIAEKN